MASQNKRSVFSRALGLAGLAAVCLSLSACGEHPRESGAITNAEWQDMVYPLRDALAEQVGDEGGETVNLEPTGWATITGKFVYDGASAPVPRPISVTGQDASVCGVHNLVDESLVVDPNSKGLANVFVFLRTKGIGDPHPSYDPNATVTLANENCHFVPHAMGIWLPQTFRITNADPVGHNTNCDSKGDTQGSFNVSVPANAEISKGFGLSKDRPADVSCSIHPWMTAKVLPRENPYFATTDAEGNFRIENVPAGIPLVFQVYHERGGNLNADPGWENGRFTVTLENDEEHDLGTIKVNPALVGG